ncbi:MAG: ATP-grasp domain-containing protein [Magnetococcales bacterium]|nr:ATP-grasp domain-containing protein [Magnetococcales bacterium]
MRIGFVYDLRDDYLGEGFSPEAVVEFDTEATIGAIAACLTGMGHEVDRIGRGHRLAARLLAGERWDLVFSIAEGVSGRSREAQVPALLEMFDQPYLFSDPLTMALTLDKAVCKRVVRDAGVPTPPFAVLSHPDEAAGLELGFPVFVKPLSEGTGKGCDLLSLVEGAGALRKVVLEKWERYRQPLLVESFLPGREFTVGVVGNGARAEVIAVMEILLNDMADPLVYSMDNKEMCESRVIYRLIEGPLAETLAARALLAHQVLGCRDTSRVDFRCDEAGDPQFLEVNPLPGLHPSHSDLPILAALAGLPYEGLMAKILEAGVERLGLSPTPAGG